MSELSHQPCTVNSATGQAQTPSTIVRGGVAHPFGSPSDGWAILFGFLASGYLAIRLGSEIRLSYADSYGSRA